MIRLDQEPKAQPRTVEEVTSLAAAMEREAAERYTHLAAEMKQRGDHGLAATFEAMVEEERDHLAAIERWSQKATQQPPGTASDTWELPAEIARSWDEVRESALLTPYRALGVAVINEERGFAFYSYIAARAEDRSVQIAAELLASEELRHAALLRRERRRAYRREREARAAEAMQSTPIALDFLERAHEMERRAAELHGAISERLTALSHSEDAVALAAVAEHERTAAAALDYSADETPVKPPAHHLSEHDRIGLLRAGLVEAERIYDTYADAVDHAGTEPVLLAAQEGAGRAVHYLGLIAARLYAPAS
jgi:rubrerythrin